ncbi:MAG TPA: hypothetical protein VE996_00510 [Terriglobales bacterium]|nr:hypothetical protein [Terriglobales bacterium]
MRRRGATVEFDGVTARRATAKALLCRIGGAEFWVPFSQIEPPASVPPRQRAEPTRFPRDYTACACGGGHRGCGVTGRCGLDCDCGLCAALRRANAWAERHPEAGRLIQ